jgi:hypothetical protein
MKNLLLAVCLVTIVNMVVPDRAVAQSNTGSAGLIVYRDSNGHLTHASKRSAKQMVQLADQNSHITLWLTLNYPFVMFVDETAENAIEAQNRAIRHGFGEILDPLVARGLVWHPKSGSYFKGPGCTVRATVAGLRELIADDRILQIVAVE